MTSAPTSKKSVRIAVHSVDRLLDVDGSPLREPHLHPDVAEAIWSETMRTRMGIAQVEVELPTDEASRQAEVTAAIHHHFEKEAVEFTEELRGVFREGWRSLAIGLLVVAALIAASEALLYLNANRIMQVLSESLIIIAWVALWHPAELLLYAHFPIRRQLRAARALAQATVKLRVA